MQGDGTGKGKNEPGKDGGRGRKSRDDLSPDDKGRREGDGQNEGDGAGGKGEGGKGKKGDNRYYWEAEEARFEVS